MQTNGSVLHILWSGGIGGKERALYQLIRSQMQWSKYRPAIAFGRSDGPYVSAFKELQCPVVELSLGSGLDLVSLPRAKRLLSPFDCHHFHSMDVPVLLASSMSEGTVRVFTHRSGASQASFKKRLRNAVASWLMARQFHGFSANTRHAAAVAARVTRIPPPRWSLTYNGFDFSLLVPNTPREIVAEALGLPHNSLVVGTAANLRRLKRVDLLISAFRAIPHPEAYLVVLGDGPDRQRLVEHATSAGLGQRVLFPGMQRHPLDYFQIMDCFVLPSGQGESFGNAVVEAMALGIPSIVFADGGGLPEHIENQATGYIVNSVDDLAERLHLLLSDADLRRRIGAAGAAAVRTRYSLQNMTAAYDRLYDSAFACKRQLTSRVNDCQGAQ